MAAASMPFTTSITGSTLSSTLPSSTQDALTFEFWQGPSYRKDEEWVRRKPKRAKGREAHRASNLLRIALSADTTLNRCRRTGRSADSPPARDDYSHTRSDLRAALLGTRNKDGGWGYAPGRRSRIEPTCWAALALGHSEGHSPDVESLRVWKRQDDWLVDVPGVPPNTAFNALAG